jgi:uncharacterized alkaline shock family protein YloU/adenylate kinase family enzyme
MANNKFWKYLRKRNLDKHEKPEPVDEEYFFEPDKKTTVKTTPFQDIKGTLTKFTGVVSKNQLDRALAENQRLKEETQKILSAIRVIAFIGSSGTGKSTRAIQIAKERGIEYLVDDGLLINGGKVAAGLSAKRARSKLESVRQALFVDENRAEGMRRALKEHLPEKLMVLGTSEGMLEKICENLWLEKPSETILIEEVTTEEERRRAVFVRSTQGQHTIPVPSMEIKHEFSGYFSDPLNRLLRKRNKSRNISQDMGMEYVETERTVVRPTFSTLGSYSISDEAMADIARLIIARKIPGVHEVLTFQIEKQSNGVMINMELSLNYGYNAQEVLKEVQDRVSSGIEDYTSINIVFTNVKAKRLISRNHAVSQATDGRELA